MSRITVVFVYGTLRRDQHYHPLIAHCRFVGDAAAVGYALFNLGRYPAMVAGQGRVAGELYEVDEATMIALDQLEGAPDYYRRTMVRLDDGREVLSYLFVDDDELRDATPIVTGDWLRR